MLGLFALITLAVAHVEFRPDEWAQTSGYSQDGVNRNFDFGRNITDDTRYPEPFPEEGYDYPETAVNAYRHLENTQLYEASKTLVSLTSKVKGEAWSNVTHMKLALHQAVKIKTIPVKGGYEEARRFQTNDGQHIGLLCQLDVISDPECSRDFLLVDIGDGNSKKYCGRGTTKLISIANTILVRTKVLEKGGKIISCSLKAVTSQSSLDFINMGVSTILDDEPPGSRRTSCYCGPVRPLIMIVPYIINGIPVITGDYPFMVSLEDSGYNMYCGGSIITPNHVLTAAHCLLDKFTKQILTPAEVIIGVGKNHRFDDEPHGKTQYYKSSKVKLHEQYDAETKHHDIGIVTLQKSIQFNRFVSPICLSPIELPVSHQSVTFLGWGETHQGIGSMDLLQATGKVYYSLVVCKRRHLFLCIEGNNRSSSCFGDSGGPVIWLDPETNRYTQVSLVSHGFNRCRHKFFVTSNVTNYYWWIQKQISLVGRNDRLCIKV